MMMIVVLKPTSQNNHYSIPGIAKKKSRRLTGLQVFQEQLCPNGKPLQRTYFFDYHPLHNSYNKLHNSHILPIIIII